MYAFSFFWWLWWCCCSFFSYNLREIFTWVVMLIIIFFSCIMVITFAQHWYCKIFIFQKKIGTAQKAIGQQFKQCLVSNTLFFSLFHHFFLVLTGILRKILWSSSFLLHGPSNHTLRTYLFLIIFPFFLWNKKRLVLYLIVCDWSDL